MSMTDASARPGDLTSEPLHPEGLPRLPDENQDGTDEGTLVSGWGPIMPDGMPPPVAFLRRRAAMSLVRAGCVRERPSQ
jgi:hypothetical protein